MSNDTATRIAEPVAAGVVLVTRMQAAAMLSMSLATFDRARAEGAVPAPHYVGGKGRTLRWSVDTLRKWSATEPTTKRGRRG